MPDLSNDEDRFEEIVDPAEFLEDSCEVMGEVVIKTSKVRKEKKSLLTF